jgi:hypothetical protein
MEDVPDVIIISVSFVEDLVQVEFVEERKQTDHVSHVESMTVARDTIEEEAGELESAAREILDKMHVLQRNPPEARPRLREETDDDE